MNKPTKPPEQHDYQKILKALTNFGVKLGSDTLIFSLVIGLIFGGMWKSEHSTLVTLAGISILLLWIVNKGISAYIEENRSNARLRELKLTQGRSLLQKHHRKRQLALPAPKKK